MLSSQTLNVFLRAHDQFSSVLGKFSSKLRDSDATAKMLGKTLQFGGAGLTAFGAGGAFATGLFQIPGQIGRIDLALRQLQVVGNLTDKEMENIRDHVRSIAKETNNTQEEILAGLSDLVAKTGDPKWSIRLMQAIGKTSTAESTAITDLSSLAFTTANTMQVPVDRLQRAFNIMTEAGKLGSFELKDMASNLPEITALARMLGITGERGIAQISSMMQIAKLASPSPDEATTSVRSFLMQLTSQESQTAFRAVGVDIRKMVMSGMNDPNRDIFVDIFSKISQLSKNDPFLMSFLQNNVRAQKFINQMIIDLPRYQKIRDAAFKAPENTVDNDYTTMMNSFLNQWKLLKIGMTDEANSPLLGPLAAGTALLKGMNSSSLALKATLFAVVGSLGLGGALVITGTLARSFKDIAELVDLIRKKELATLAIRVASAAAEKSIFIWKNAAMLGPIGIGAALGIGAAYLERQSEPFMQRRRDDYLDAKAQRPHQDLSRNPLTFFRNEWENWKYTFGKGNGTYLDSLKNNQQEAQRDTVDLTVSFDGAPPGTRLKVNKSPGINLTTAMGLNLGFAGGIDQ